MRTRAVFLGTTMVAAALVAAIGVTMVVNSNDGSPQSNVTFSGVAGTSAPASDPSAFGESYAITTASVPDKSVVGNVPVDADSARINSGLAATGGNDGGTAADALVERKIERTATLEINVDDVLNTVNKIQAAATAAGGYVSQQSISEQPGPDDADGKPTKRQLATVQIRIPSDQYNGVMSGLRGLAKDVTSEDSQTTEVTGQYTDLQSQLRNLQATEQQYLTLMTQAATVSDILTVQDRLSSVRAQIEQVQGQINLLDNLSDMATITVSVSLPPIVETNPTKPSEENWAEEAVNNAWDASQGVLEFMGVVAITAGVVMVWILVPGVLGLAGWRLLGGRKSQGPAASS